MFIILYLFIWNRLRFVGVSYRIYLRVIYNKNNLKILYNQRHFQKQIKSFDISSIKFRLSEYILRKFKQTYIHSENINRCGCAESRYMFNHLITSDHTSHNKQTKCHHTLIGIGWDRFTVNLVTMPPTDYFALN